MNLQLEQKGGTHVLKISGDVDLKGTAILRAGVAKLMKSGKDKIILEMSAVGGLHETFVKEIADLAKLAGELGGKIVIAGAPTGVVSTLKAAPDAPTFTILAGIDESVNFLQKTGQVAATELPPEIAAVLKERDGRISALENQIALSNPEEIRKLRQENEALRESQRLLETQLGEMIAERRLPPDAQAVIERINVLERNVKDMSASLQAGGHAKK